MKDRMCQVFDFAGDSWNGINRKVMISGYVVVAKVISVLTIAAALYLYHPLLSILVLLAPLSDPLQRFSGGKAAVPFCEGEYGASAGDRIF